MLPSGTPCAGDRCEAAPPCDTAVYLPPHQHHEVPQQPRPTPPPQEDTLEVTRRALEIMAQNAATIRSIPHAAVAPCTKSLAQTLESFNRSGKWDDLVKVLAWAKVVLQSPGRGGKAHWDKNTRAIIQRATTYPTQPLDGNSIPSLPEGKARRLRRRKGVVDDTTRQAVMRSISEGAYTVAAKQLLSSGTFDVLTPEVVAN